MKSEHSWNRSVHSINCLCFFISIVFTVVGINKQTYIFIFWAAYSKTVLYLSFWFVFQHKWRFMCVIRALKSPSGKSENFKRKQKDNFLLKRTFALFKSVFKISTTKNRIDINFFVKLIFGYTLDVLKGPRNQFDK